MMGVCSPSLTEKGHPYCSIACAKGRDDTGSSHVTAERAEQAQVSCLHNANLTRSLMDMVEDRERERASEMCAHAHAFSSACLSVASLNSALRRTHQRRKC